MNLPKKILHKIHTVSINRTRKGLQRLDEFLLRTFPNTFLNFQTTDSLQTRKLSKLQPPFSLLLLNTPIDRIRAWDFFRTDQNIHPYYFALSQSQTDDGLDAHTLKANLNAYYKKSDAFNAAQWLGLDRNHTYWSQYISWGKVLPWNPSTPEQRIVRIKADALKDSSEHGLALDISHGWPWIGPVSSSLLSLETSRLKSLYRSIISNGYTVQPYKENVGGTLLVKNSDEWVVVCAPGQHRAIVAAFIGEKYIPVEITRIARRSDVHKWPQVRRGTYTVDEALSVFDRIMEGRLPPAFAEWEAYVAKHVTDKVEF